jgi:rubrerythrin
MAKSKKTKVKKNPVFTKEPVYLKKYECKICGNKYEKNYSDTNLMDCPACKSQNSGQRIG